MLLVSLFYLVIVTLLPIVSPCMIVIVGKNATVDGSTFVAHTDDAGSGAADLRLVRVPAMEHEPDSVRHVYNFFGGYPRVVTNQRGKHYMPKDDQELTVPLGSIPQVRYTYGYFDQDYGMQNDQQLSISESTCSARTVGWPKDVPYGNNLFGIAELSKIALERCDSARCAIQLMGDLAVKYGFYSEDSGNPNAPDYEDSAEALGIADRYGETWIFHILTGPNNSSAVWAAQRVPDGHVSAIANSFSIRRLNLKDEDNYMASDNVFSFAQDMGWWDPNESEFDFTSVYAFDDRPSCIGALYTGRRLWRIFDIFAPSLKLDPYVGFMSTEETYPFSVEPDELIHIKDVMNVMRDYYEGTPFDLTKGFAAGPFGTPVRYGSPSYNLTGGWERSISVYQAAYSFVLQSRGHLPNEIGGVMWYGQDAPHGTAYVPFYCSQNEVPESYLLGIQSEFHPQSSWWAFNFVNNWSQLRFSTMIVEIKNMYTKIEREGLRMQSRIEQHVLDHYRDSTHDAVHYLQKNANEFAEYVVQSWWNFAWKLVSRYSGGYITTGEKPEEMISPGYPYWWLDMSEFKEWPGFTFQPPDMFYSTASASQIHKHQYKLMFVGIIGSVALLSIVLHRISRRRGYVAV